ncbi:UNKNOWN [Stylonychia lemnae]|uniref:Uncharacterized protein n=1 Tax=Stylonychia lemnae TaxID=5949 RepID=A0A078AWB7_STYLE|nr:UNKNOWN [Stylonychia lemnae]|eukprot:CDW86760.1 UNKNOWN [Stylonychia lemnae]
MTQTIYSTPFNQLLQNIQIDTKLIPIYIFFALEDLEQVRIQKLKEQFLDMFHLNDQEKKVLDFNFNQFGSFADQWFNDVFSNEDLKFQLFLPLCTGGNMLNDIGLNGGFNNMLESAFELLNVNQYNQSVIYNKKLFDQNEKLVQLKDQKPVDNHVKSDQLPEQIQLAEFAVKNVDKDHLELIPRKQRQEISSDIDLTKFAPQKVLRKESAQNGKMRKAKGLAI